MEKQYRHSTAGAEVQSDDLDLLAESALMDDRVLAELLRLVGYGGSTVDRGVIPYGTSKTGLMPANCPTVTPSALPDGKVVVMPCRVVVGSRTTNAADPKLHWQDIRSGVVPRTAVQIPPTASNNRWDLVYARVDVDLDDPTASRLVRPGVAPPVAQNIVVSRQTKVTLGVQSGVEGATPARPAAPGDGGTYFYVPLAYVMLVHPFTSVSPVINSAIQEAFKPLVLSRALGAMSAQPATCHYKTAGAVQAASPWNPANGRPVAWLPPSMVGGEIRLLAMTWVGSLATFALGTTVVIDDSVDWRKRTFEASISAGASPFPWVNGSGAVPGVEAPVTLQHGQSFNDDAAGAIAACAGRVALLTPAKVPAMSAGSSIQIYVDSSTGELKAVLGATDPNCAFFVKITASGPFAASIGSGYVTE